MRYKGQDELYVIKDFYHLDWLFVWLVVFILCVVVVGAKKGALSLLGLGISIPLRFFVYLPLIKARFNPIILTLAVSLIGSWAVMDSLSSVGTTSSQIAGGTEGIVSFNIAAPQEPSEESVSANVGLVIAKK